MNLADPWLDAVLRRLRTDQQMAERAIAQLSDDELHRRPAPSFNSVAVIVRHVTGNLKSRWTDFLTSDGDKPDRNREGEFADWTGPRDALMREWAAGFAAFAGALESLAPGDLAKTVRIRGEPHTVPQAIVRSIDHTAYHVGQILFVARLVHSGEWTYITIAPGKSDAYNRALQERNEASR